MTREGDEEQELMMDDSAGIEGRAGPGAARTAHLLGRAQSRADRAAHRGGREE